jgi:hypothetical protein
MIPLGNPILQASSAPMDVKKLAVPSPAGENNESLARQIAFF